MLLEHPSLLAHTIYEALAFDAAILEEGFSLEGTSAAKEDEESKWEGITDVILGNADWFEIWLAAEKRCTCLPLVLFISRSESYPIVAEDQYNVIINDSDAWTVSEEVDLGSLSRDLRPTVSARRVKSLIEQVTGELLYDHQIKKNI